MAWIEVHQSLRDHRKILALADALDMPEPHVAGHCLYLWLWSLDNAPDGVLPTSARIIARAACWTGDAERFLDAMILVGMIDRSPSHLTIHDWDDYAGKIADRRERNKQAMREARAREKADRVQHVDNTSTSHDNTSKATVPNPTLPNNTVSNKATISSSGEISNKSREYAATAHAAPRTRTQKKTPRKTTQKLPENIPRPRNPLWDALEDAFNFHPVMPSEKSHLGKIVRELQEAGATPEEIPLRIARYCKRYGRDYLTLDALHKHWSEFATEPIMANGGQLDAKDREVLAANREDTKRRLYEEAMRLANDEASLDGQFPGTKVAGG